jgi:hypothetical protein
VSNSRYGLSPPVGPTRRKAYGVKLAMQQGPLQRREELFGLLADEPAQVRVPVGFCRVWSVLVAHMSALANLDHRVAGAASSPKADT